LAQKMGHFRPRDGSDPSVIGRVVSLAHCCGTEAPGCRCVRDVGVNPPRRQGLARFRPMRPASWRPCKRSLLHANNSESGMTCVLTTVAHARAVWLSSMPPHYNGGPVDPLCVALGVKLAKPQAGSTPMQNIQYR